jgi:hypothetical protein
MIDPEKGSLKLLTNHVKGVYTSDTNKPEWENKIIICYDLYNWPNKLIERFEKNIYFYAKYSETIGPKSYKVVAFHIPSKYKNDFNKIMKGDYTKVSTQYSNLVREYWAATPSLASIVNNILDGYIQKYPVHPKLEESILNLNDVPTKKEGIQSDTLLHFCSI